MDTAHNYWKEFQGKNLANAEGGNSTLRQLYLSLTSQIAKTPDPSDPPPRLKPRNGRLNNINNVFVYVECPFVEGLSYVYTCVCFFISHMFTGDWLPHRGHTGSNTHEP